MVKGHEKIHDALMAHSESCFLFPKVCWRAKESEVLGQKQSLDLVSYALVIVGYLRS